MRIKDKLNKVLLNQPFDGNDHAAMWKKYQSIADMYAAIENAISVLTDLKARKSLIHYGGITATIMEHEVGSKKEITSIWEDDILNRIHVDDQLKKHALEHNFFHFLKEQPVNEWPNYYTAIKLRILDRSDKYVSILHRMYYASAGSTVCLALCIYSFCGNEMLAVHESGIIANSATGATIQSKALKYRDVLSSREKQILSLIAYGKMSKEIAENLSISINTVNRHRQNILEKLRVKNTMEAYRFAQTMELL